MDTYLFDSSTYQKYYNCNIYHIDDIPLGQRRHIVVGSAHLGLSVMLESLYLLCLPAIYKRLEISCYKIMFFMAIVDILCLPIIGCLHGYLAIIGGVFCSAPDLIYVSGCVAMGLWGCEGIAAVFLALNRCLEIAMPKVGDFLFKGERTWCWILASLVFGIWFGFFGKPVLFSSLRLAWIFEPHNGYLPVPEPNWYHSKIEVFDDCLVMVALTVLYVLFAFVLWCKISEYRGNGTNTMASNLLKSQKMIFLQVLIVSIIHINASGVYCYMQLFTVNQFVVNMAMYGWFFAHGIPPVIYLTLNKSIRNDCYKSIKVLLRCDKTTAKTMIVTTTLTTRMFQVSPNERKFSTL